VRSRKEGFKKGLDRDQLKKKREEKSIQLRKVQREVQMAKRRRERNENESIAEEKTDLAAVDGEIDHLVELIKSGEDTVMLESVRRVRKLLCMNRGAPFEKVCNSEMLIILVQLLGVEEHDIQFEATWALTNISASSSDCTMAVVHAEAMPPLMALLESNDIDIQEQAVWALGNISGECTEFRDVLLEQGMMRHLIRLGGEAKTLSATRNIVWAISNLCKGTPKPDFTLIAPCLPELSQILEVQKDAQILSDICWALSYISDEDDEGRGTQAIIEGQFCRRLADLLQHKNPLVKIPALKTIGNLTAGDDLQTQKVIGSGALLGLHILLQNDRPVIRKDACFAVSNILAGHPDQVRNVIEQGILSELIHIVVNDVYPVQVEACFALANATNCSSVEIVSELVERFTIIDCLCEMLQCPDVAAVEVVLEGLHNILEVGQKMAEESGDGVNRYVHALESCGGVRGLQTLCHESTNPEIVKATEVLYETFIGDIGHVDSDPSLEPSTANGQFLFQPPQNGFSFGGDFSFNN